MRAVARLGHVQRSFVRSLVSVPCSNQNTCRAQTTTTMSYAEKNGVPLDLAQYPHVRSSRDLLMIWPRGAYTTMRTAKNRTAIFELTSHINRIAKSIEIMTSNKTLSCESSLYTPRTLRPLIVKWLTGAIDRYACFIDHPHTHTHTHPHSFPFSFSSSSSFSLSSSTCHVHPSNISFSFTLPASSSSPSSSTSSPFSSSSSSSSSSPSYVKKDDGSSSSNSGADDELKIMLLVIPDCISFPSLSQSSSSSLPSPPLSSFTSSSSSSSSSSPSCTSNSSPQRIPEYYVHITQLCPTPLRHLHPQHQHHSQQQQQQQSVPIHVHVAQATRKYAIAKDSDWVRDSETLLKQMPADVNEIILATPQLDLLEGISSNFFVIEEGTVRTADSHILRGTVRQLFLQICKQQHIPVSLQPPNMANWRRWSGCFISSTSRLLLPIQRLSFPAHLFPSQSVLRAVSVPDNGIVFDVNDPLTKRLQRAVEKAFADACESLH
eukprot:TRINITY_DN1345_c4_g1_i1.p1 TRINITY_DN1345_c4_g1~~TRINITY_DN1345_c4_g1_i1.p1  ORF type:complete len:490 (+),score=143.73 TRINITY_DN1345_c4_g1_i1:109-1578(+)